MTDSLSKISAWIDAGNAGRDPEAQHWGRISKIGEEFGEVIAAYIGATGQNPRKGVTHSIQNVLDELLDVALTALAAYEHLTDNRGVALEHFATHVEYIRKRAGLDT